jgi:hypothetical protein
MLVVPGGRTQRVKERLCEKLQADPPNMRGMVFRVSFIRPESMPDARRQCLDTLVGLASIFSKAQRADFSHLNFSPRGESLSWDILSQRKLGVVQRGTWNWFRPTLATAEGTAEKRNSHRGSRKNWQRKEA